MCFAGGQPAAPINKPTYAADDADKYFDVTMEDETTGRIKPLGGRTTEQNKNATQGKT